MAASPKKRSVRKTSKPKKVQTFSRVPWLNKTRLIIVVAVVAIVGVVAVVASFAATPATSGAVRIMSGIKSKTQKCLDNRGAVVKVNNKTIIYTCSKSNAQKWVFMADGTIRPSTGPDYCLQPIATQRTTRVLVTDTVGGPKSKPQYKNVVDTYYPVSIQSCNASVTAQKWTANLDQYSGGQIINKASGRCLDVSNNNPTDGNIIIAYPCKTTASRSNTANLNQIWYKR
jgi:hypothetical protein